MAQYGGDQQYGQEVRQTDEYGNPVVTTNEYETVVRSADGARYEHEVTRTDEYGNIVRVTEQYKNKAVHSAGDYGSTGHHLGLGQADRGTGIGYGTGDQGLGTNIGHSVGSTGTDYPSGGRSTGQTGYQGLGTERGDTTGVHHGLSQADRGIGTGTYGTGHDQGLGTTIGRATGGTGTTDYTSVGRSTGQTGHQGLGTEPGSGVTTGVYQPSATPMGGAGIGTGTKDVYGGTGLGTGGHGYGDTHEKKGVIEKIKEKLPGGHSSDEQPHTTTTTTAGAGGGGYGGTHEKQGMIEKIKEKLPGHH